MKRRLVVAGLLSLVFAALAITFPLWWSVLVGAFPAIKQFLKDNEEVQTLADLIQIVLWLATPVTLLSGYLLGRRAEREQATTTYIATGGGAHIGEVEVDSGSVSGRDQYLLSHWTINVGSRDEIQEKRLAECTDVRWSERNKAAVEFFVSSCDECPKDEDRLLRMLQRWHLVIPTTSGINFSREGALLFGPTDELPAGSHTDVQIDDRRFDPPRVKHLNGHCLLVLIQELQEYLSGLWQEQWEDPSRRDESGRPIKLARYPQTAIIETLVNLVIHRDYSVDDLAFVVITDDHIEFTNPGLSPFSPDELLSSDEPLHPKYLRNRHIIKAISRTRLNQRQGGGILRIREALERNRNLREDGTLGIGIQNDTLLGRFTLTMYQGHLSKQLGLNQQYSGIMAALHQEIDFIGFPQLRERHPLSLTEVFVGPSLTVADRGDAQPISLSTSLQRSSRVVILGDPGSGKTTLLRYVALAFARGQSEQLLGLVENRIPIFIRLVHYVAERAQRNSGYSLVDHLYSEAKSSLALDLEHGFFEANLAKGNCCICLDGLDEIVELSRRREIVRLVASFANAYPENRFVVASRIVGYEEMPLSRSDFAHYTICPFPEESIRQFVANWYLARERDPAMADSRATDLLHIILSNREIKNLAANPLLLTIITLVHSLEAELPSERVRLYEKIVTMFLDTWEVVKRPIEERKEPFYTYRRRLLEGLAFWMHQECRHLAPVGDLRLQIAHRLVENRRLNLDEVRALQQADLLIEWVRSRTGLLVESGEGMYGFASLTFQEYLAACDIENRSVHLGVEGIWREIEPHVCDPRWREVLLLLFSNLNKYLELPSLLLRRILESSSDDPGTQHDVLLAGYVLAAHIEVESSLRSEILERLRVLKNSGGLAQEEAGRILEVISPT